MGLFSGLEALGLGKLKDAEVFEKEAAPEKEIEVVQPQKSEADVLLDKKYECPVCQKEFTSKIVRQGKNKLLKQDTDLRGIYDNADTVKYDPVVCTHCGFAALTRFFKAMPIAQEKLIRENICAGFNGLPETGDFYTYDDAITRYKLVLANTVVKRGKNSEKAYVCLKLAWAFRGKADNLPADEPNREQVLKGLKASELECLNNAYEGFVAAFSQESFPMCGMDEVTVIYMTAELARRIGKLDEATRLASTVITNRAASERIKDRAREVKDLVKAQKEKTS